METPMQNINKWFSLLTGFENETIEKIVVSLLIIIILWIIRHVVIRVVKHKTEDIRSRYIWQKTSKYITFILGIMLIARLWFEMMQDITTYLGLLSAGIAIALKDVISNIAGWVFLMWTRPLGIGDRIQIGDHAGDVIDISLFSITLMEIGNWVDSDQSTGRIIKIPNGRVFVEAVANYSKGFQFIWNEIPVLLTFESDWKKAKNILTEISHKHVEHLSKKAAERVVEASMRFMIVYSKDKLTPIVYTTVKDCGVLLTIRYLCKPQRRRGTEQVIWESILQAFSECDDIDFAYPTWRLYNNMSEGKPGTKHSMPENGI